MKKIILICLVLLIGVSLGFIATMYFNFWKEPAATRAPTDNPKLISIRKDLDELKDELRKEGNYNCCINHDCDWCALYMGHCPCAQMIQKEGQEMSCPECAAAWNKKQGKIPGVDPDAVGVTTFGVYGYEEEGHHYQNSKDEHKGSHAESIKHHNEH